jgi:hypothetical protein
MCENTVWLDGRWFRHPSIPSRTNALLSLDNRVIVATEWTRDGKITGFRPAERREQQAARRRRAIYPLMELPVVSQVYRAESETKLWLLEGPTLLDYLARTTGWILTLGTPDGTKTWLKLRRLRHAIRPQNKAVSMWQSTTWDPDGDAILSFDCHTGLLSRIEFQPLH